MTKKTTVTTKATRKKKEASDCSPSPLTPAWAHASELVRRLILLMEQGIDPATEIPEHWERIFGTKESAVGNLQKLVSVLANIAQHMQQPEAMQQQDEAPLSKDDYAMLMRWLEDELKNDAAN